MKKKIISLLTFVILLVGVFAGYALAKEKQDLKLRNPAKPLNQQISNINNSGSKAKMIELLKEYGYKDLATALENGDYSVMDSFMNNISDKDYKNMIEIMRRSGYESMANMMASISKEDMVKMHNAMGGAKACHGGNGNTNGMMSNF